MEEDTPTEDEKQLGMSKKQRKRLEKHQLFLERRKVKRQEKRQRKKEEKRKLQQEKEAEEGGEKVNLSGPFPKKFKSMSSEDASSLRIAIDLSFDDLMSDRDLQKLLKQVQRVYSINRRAQHPVQLYLTSFGAKAKTKLEEIKCNYQQWDIHIKTEGYSGVFATEDIVYLTSDSPNVLKEVDQSKAYIIGGLVDHNHHKGLCHNLAVERGIVHAQLPIAEFVQLNSRKVLAVNHVFEILLQFTESKDWKDAFYKVLPSRKVLSESKFEDEKEGNAPGVFEACGEEVEEEVGAELDKVKQETS